MCGVTFMNPVFCRCQNEECPRVRPREERLFLAGKIPWRRHILHGGTWEKTLQHDGLPCNNFWAMPGAPEAVGRTGRGDEGMWEVAIANCPSLRPRILPESEFCLGSLCEHCKEHCDQREASVTPKASELNPPDKQGPKPKSPKPEEFKAPPAGTGGMLKLRK